MEKAADEMISIDQPIVDPMKMIKSGINLDNSPNVDQSSKMEIVMDIPVIKQIENTTLLQAILQLQNIIADLTKSSNKKKKDILVYDISVSWTPEEILKQLTLWGKTISMQTKRQRKYQTVRLSIELSTFRLAQFEVNENPMWTTDLGDTSALWKDSCPHSFLSAVKGLKSFKIIQTAKGINFKKSTDPEKIAEFFEEFQEETTRDKV
ncbi:hypothetical protein GLOIN_2v1765605 [Rhizophagus irregularis DAOM 181602=DAOM 197198]|nr:hypothetical protein GLOIN_2v1765605 [Rhizophagus irregularis DAOM 181602=DAOM 197198]